ncbi:MAG: DUF45 domain-containing protein [Acholeplasma sp.]|nr:DUF45 domain-containing protein [Acholeplasma sp.]
MIKYLIKDDKQIPYKIINKNNKNTYFKFKNGYLEISKSKFMNEEFVLNIVNGNFSKYYKKLSRVKEFTPKDDEIILEGRNYKLIINDGHKFSYEMYNDHIIVKTKITDNEQIKKKIYNQQLSEMLENINGEIKITLDNNDINVRPIKLGYFKTKFGSYHRDSDIIKINIILAKLDINHLKYVLLHEYAHTKVFNHSRDFYLVLEKLMPDYRNYDKNLKNVSISL